MRCYEMWKRCTATRCCCSLVPRKVIEEWMPQSREEARHLRHEILHLEHPRALALDKSQTTDAPPGPGKKRHLIKHSTRLYHSQNVLVHQALHEVNALKQGV